jgi:Flp pilus assembly protein TadG
MSREPSSVDGQEFRHPADKTTRMGDDPTPTTPDRDALGRFSLGRAHRQLRLRGARGERGQALVEFALVLPVLMLLLVGIIKGGLLYNNYLQLTDAVRTGTRTLAIERGQGTPCADASNTILASASGLDRTKISISMTEAGNATADSGCPFTLASGSAVTVQATYPCDLSVLGVNFIPGCQLKATATERVE